MKEPFRPLLSICIPTYNRDFYLKQCLESIFSEIKKNKAYKEVEVVIQDNSSTDSTEKIVKEELQKNQTIVARYHRNTSNLGFDRSFVRLIENSRGVYCLSLGDDDALMEGSLEEILKHLKSQNIPFFGLNAWGYDANLKIPLLKYPNIKDRENKAYPTLKNYIKSIKPYSKIVGIFVGLSTQLFERDSFVNFKGKENYFDTLAVHTYTLLKINKDKPYLFIAKPVIKTRASNIRWDVFAGLQTAKGRILSTLSIISWIDKEYDLKIPKSSLLFYFYIREYWFTWKEIFKILLKKKKLDFIINHYRLIRSKIS